MRCKHSTSVHASDAAWLRCLRNCARWPQRLAEVLDAASKAARQAMQEREHHLADIRHLRTEVDDLAADKAAAEKRCAQAVHAAEARAAVAQAAQLEAQHLLEGAHARRRALEGEVSQLDVSGRRLAEQVHACRREVSQQAARAEAERAAHADEARAWDAAAREAAARAEEQRAEVAAEARATERRLEAQIAAAQADLEHLRREVCTLPTHRYSLAWRCQFKGRRCVQVASKVAEAEAPLHARVQELQAEAHARDGEHARLNVQAQERADAAAQRAALLESEVARLCEELKGAREEVCRCGNRVDPTPLGSVPFRVLSPSAGCICPSECGAHAMHRLSSQPSYAAGRTTLVSTIKFAVQSARRGRRRACGRRRSACATGGQQGPPRAN